MQTGAARGVPVYVRIYSAKGLTMPLKANSADELTPAAILCRTGGHRFANPRIPGDAAWIKVDDYIPAKGKGPARARVRPFCVNNCGTARPGTWYKIEKSGKMRRDFDAPRGGYKYMDNYLLAKGTDFDKYDYQDEGLFPIIQKALKS